MSKVVKVYNGDYKIAVEEGGTIYLDTGTEVGTTIVTGDLQVKGTTTTVNSTEVTIEDNIIILSANNPGPGLPNGDPIYGLSGIEIERGSSSNVRWVYDENITWDLGPISSVTQNLGTFYAKAGNQLLPLHTPGIDSPSTLYLYPGGSGTVSVTNTVDYEERIWYYTGTPSVITPDANGAVTQQDDNIPNAKAVVDYVDYIFNSQFAAKIAEGDTFVETIDEYHSIGSVVSIQPGISTVIRTNGQHGFTVTDTVTVSGVDAAGDNIENLNGTNIGIIEIISPTALRLDADTSGGTVSTYVPNSGIISKTGYTEARVKIQVDGVNNVDFFSDRVDIEDLTIEDTSISVNTTGQILTLSAPGGGSVRVNDVFEISKTPHDSDPLLDPAYSTDSIKLYAKDRRAGKVGLYYVNNDNVRDEIVSKNRSLLFSMLF